VRSLVLSCVLLASCAADAGLEETADADVGAQAEALTVADGDEAYVIAVESIEPFRTNDEPPGNDGFISMIATSADMSGGTPVPMWPAVRHFGPFATDMRVTTPLTVYRNDVNGAPAASLMVTMTPVDHRRMRLVVLGDADTDDRGVPADTQCIFPGGCTYPVIHDFLQKFAEQAASDVGRAPPRFVDPTPEQVILPIGPGLVGYPVCTGSFMTLAFEFSGRELHDMTENPGRVAFLSDWVDRTGGWKEDWCGDLPRTRYVISIRRVVDAGFFGNPPSRSTCTLRPVANAPASAWHFQWGDVGRYENDEIRAMVSANDPQGASFNTSSWLRTDYISGSINTADGANHELTSWMLEPFDHNEHPAPSFITMNGSRTIGADGNVDPISPRCSYFSNLPPYWQDAADGNRVRDPGFENQPHGGHSPPWTAEINGGFSGTDRGIGFSRTGNNNGWIWSAAPGWNAIVQDVFVEPNRSYRASIWVRTSNVQWGYFGVRDAANNIIRETSYGATTGYRQLTVDFHSGSRSKVRLFFGYWGPGSASYAQFDDAYVGPPPAPPWGSPGGGFDTFSSWPSVDRIPLSDSSELQLWGEYDELGNHLAYRTRYLRWDTETGETRTDVMLRPSYQLR
jgi:hypothetical protein